MFRKQSLCVDVYMCSTDYMSQLKMGGNKQKRIKIRIRHPEVVKAESRYIMVEIFWLICFINQRALYNHALSVVRRRCWCRHWHHWCLCTPLTATGLNIETSYSVHLCTYVPIYMCTCTFPCTSSLPIMSLYPIF